MHLELPHLLFLAGLLTYLSIRVFYRARTASVPKQISEADFQDRILILLVVVGQILLPVLYLSSRLLRFADYTLPEACVWIGACLAIYGLWLFWRSHADLGKNWSVTLELGNDHQLITEGVYRHVRHPMYASFIALGLSQAMLLNNWIAGWAAFIAVFALCVARIPREERMMVEHFGNVYRSYQGRTGRVFPRVR
ncbi:isoprenylcysteine carboxylmethyltransferase family protein [Comamonas thiooxydans]|uniref:protein-S-isoprenylcysteine O-methyltransferase n=1 Tax=Comamonas thiooxydans TaxID=363952 RepID=UPI000B35B662|nr:protein-S-isoprenylcysteine O-methyltransferase [Comamonas thiooxydans]BDR10212.1 isoprenylcysteine carboxylmethyltransferase family protein [Comamonas thiooxydans]